VWQKRQLPGVFFVAVELRAARPPRGGGRDGSRPKFVCIRNYGFLCNRKSLGPSPVLVFVFLFDLSFKSSIPCTARRSRKIGGRKTVVRPGGQATNQKSDALVENFQAEDGAPSREPPVTRLRLSLVEPR